MASKNQKTRPPKVAFPKKNLKPRPGEFAARLPLPVGKRFEGVRAFLAKQKGVTEEIFFYGPKSGWAFRYRRQEQPVCTLLIHAGRPLGILSLDKATASTVTWSELSPVGQKARKVAHGSPSLLWVDVPLDGTGAGDFKTIVRAKLKAPPAQTPAARTPAARIASTQAF